MWICDLVIEIVLTERRASKTDSVQTEPAALRVQIVFHTNPISIQVLFLEH